MLYEVITLDVVKVAAGSGQVRLVLFHLALQDLMTREHLGEFFLLEARHPLAHLQYRL